MEKFKRKKEVGLLPDDSSIYSERELKARVRVYVRGRVQGVFFRASTAREAKIRDVMGWVRNLWDGRVEAVFEGEKDLVEQMVVFCRSGPPGAVVTSVDVSWEKYTGKYRNFRVRYTRF